MTQHIDDERILNVWSWCSDAYLRHGRRLSLPAATDPTKTYQWRYATAIANKFVEWDLTDEAAKKFIDIAVSTAKERGIWQKGLAILHQANMLDICYDKLMAESTSNTQTIESISHTKAWLNKKLNNRQILPALLDRNDPQEFCNLTIWFQASRLPPLFVALSRNCGLALDQLTKHYSDERALLPRDTELYMLRSSFLKDRKNANQARIIFENDWR